MLIKNPTLFKRLMMKLKLNLGRTKAQNYKIISKKGIYKVVLITATDKDTNINISTSFEDAGNLTKLAEESGIAEAELVNYVETKALGCIEYRKEVSLTEESGYGNENEKERASQKSISNKTIRTKRATKSEYLTQFLAQGSEKIIPYATFFTRNSAERFKEFISTSMERGMSIANANM